MKKRFLKRVIVALIVVGAGAAAYISKGMPLGIDLAGGAELLYRLDDQELKQEQDLYTGYLSDLGNKEKVAALQAELKDKKARLDTATDPLEKSILQRDIDNISLRLNKTAIELVLKNIDEQLGGKTTQVAADIIRQRINPAGTMDVVVTRMEPNRVRIQIPYQTDSKVDDATAKARFNAKVADLTAKIETTGSLTFHLVIKRGAKSMDLYRLADEKLKKRVSPPAGYLYAIPTAEYDGFAQEMREAGKPMSRGYIKAKPGKQKDDKEESLLLEEDNHGLTGSILANAYPNVGEKGYQIDMVFLAEGSQLFGKVTGENVGERLAIVLDGVMQSAPVIRSRITGRGQIEGNFTEQEARDLALVLKSGRLPMKVHFESKYVVGPSLGQDSIDKGIKSVLIGGALVVLFMLIYYRAAGFVADVALVLNLGLIIGAMSLTNATLTLPGIAGILLTIGMAVDANILIFERIREEKDAGRPLDKAVDTGFDRAFVTIIDANVTTLIAAVVLYEFGTGPIRGFAVTLMMGILANLFTALFISRFILEWLVMKNVVKSLSMMRIVSGTKIPFMALRIPAFIVSILLVGGGIYAFFAYEDKYGIDFSGGTLIQVSFREGNRPTADELRPAAQAAAAQVGQEFGLASTGIVKVQTFEEGAFGGGGTASAKKKFTLTTVLAGPQVDRMKEILTEALSGQLDDDPFPATTSIGPNVAKELGKAAFLAVAVALLLTFFYIVLRFDFSASFGFGAIVALFHDVSIALGAMIVADWLGWMEVKIDLPIIAALLTIVGYSLNDTIVVYDRIRENRTNQPNMPIREVIDLSINQMLGRTLLTSFTTFLAVAVLFLFGGGVIHGFAFVFMVGVIVGTYSSVFIASPVVATFYRTKTESPKKQ
ncbi:MAG: protein translocase subunit SecD [Planctomycetes bacterium]|nr:protein translocase subunit SecD [Planctomycetota bacterium]